MQPASTFNIVLPEMLMGRARAFLTVYLLFYCLSKLARGKRWKGVRKGLTQVGKSNTRLKGEAWAVPWKGNSY